MEVDADDTDESQNDEEGGERMMKMNMKGEKCMVVGLTGGIGAGKSVVARVLREKGFEVYDCDREARLLMEGSEIIVGSLRARFGEACYHPDGRLNRPFLSERIFSSDEERLWLNSIVHEAVREDIRRRVEKEEKGRGILFVESAILHTSRLDCACATVWIVTAPESLRFERALRRGGIDAANLRARMQTQKAEFDAIESPEIIEIDNSGSLSLLRQIDDALRKLIKN